MLPQRRRPCPRSPCPLTLESPPPSSLPRGPWAIRIQTPAAAVEPVGHRGILSSRAAWLQLRVRLPPTRGLSLSFLLGLLSPNASSSVRVLSQTREAARAFQQPRDHPNSGDPHLLRVQASPPLGTRLSRGLPYFDRQTFNSCRAALSPPAVSHALLLRSLGSRVSRLRRGRGHHPSSGSPPVLPPRLLLCWPPLPP